MADVHNAETRSYNMSRIRSKDTKPEMVVRQRLFAAGYRYRLHQKDLPGKPDIVLKKHKTALFIHGCFWHGHEGCRYFVVPKTRTDWWLNKINRNKELDRINAGKLREAGWKVIEIYECQLKKDETEKTLQRLTDELGKTPH